MTRLSLRRGIAVLAFSLLAVVAVAPSQANHGPLPTIAELALGNEDLELLVAAADNAGLVPTLLDPDAGPFTVFAPTDEAFDAFMMDTGIDVMTADSAAVKGVLDDHILPGRFKSFFLKLQSRTGNRLTTDGGLSLGFGADPFQVNGVDIVISQIPASNGVVYVIDEVLVDPAPSIADIAVASDGLGTLVAAIGRVPGLAETLDTEGPFTVFAPTDAAFEALGIDLGDLTDAQIEAVLLNHVVNGSYTDRELFQAFFTRTSLTALGGLNLRFRGFFGFRVNRSRFVVTNISAANGTIHVIDRVLD